MTVEASKLKLAKRKLRVERCKTQSARFPKPAPRIRDGERTSKPSVPAVVGAKPKPSDATKAHHVSNPASRTYVPTPITIPKGDPALGDRLRSLSKEDRRLAKANDPTRAARRLAKKKASTAVKAASASKVKGGVLGNLKKAGRPKNPAKTSRVRSERSAMKRNVKK
jgi:nucleolar protein 12